MDGTDAPVDEEQTILTVNTGSSKPIAVDVQLIEKSLSTDMVTGASVSLVLENTFRDMFPSTSLKPSKVKLHTSSREVLPVAGEAMTTVMYGDQQT